MKHKNDKGEYFEKIQKSENNKNSDGSVKKYGKWKIAYMKLHDFVGKFVRKLTK